MTWLTNLLGRVPPSQRATVAAMLRTIFAQDTREAAHEQWRKVADGLRERFAEAAELMDGAEHDVLAYHAFPKEHLPQLASTNPLEGLNGEIKRRTEVVAIFPNRGAVTRLVGAILLEQNDEWAAARRYMTLKTIRSSRDTALVSLFTMAG